MSDARVLHGWKLGLGLMGAALAGCQLPSVPTGDYVGPAPDRAERLAAASQPSTSPEGIPETAPAAIPTTVPATGDLEQGGAIPPLVINIDDAILMAVENNPQLAVQKLSPAIRRTIEQLELAAFDPVLSASVSQARTANDGGGDNTVYSDGTSADLSLSEFFPTGTDVRVGATTDLNRNSVTNHYSDNTRFGLSVTQSLLRGFGTDVNLASLRQARIDTRISEYELRGVAESLVADVESAYWDYALAQRQIEIVTEALRIAQQQLADTRERVQVGKLATLELAASEAEVATRMENLINARAAEQRARLQMLRLLSLPGPRMWERTIQVVTPPSIPMQALDRVQSHVDVAMRLRPDLNQAKLEIDRNELQIVKTRNGLLPKLDLFITLGKTGYADSFGRTFSDLNGDNYDLLAGLQMQYPLKNRAAEATYQASLLGQQQSQYALVNLEQLAQLDVRTAYVEVERTREQIGATRTTRKSQEAKANAEVEKWRAGKSTTLLVASAQRDLLAARIAEVQAVVNYLKSVINLYQLEGSLLERRGILAPGAAPVRNAPETRG